MVAALERLGVEASFDIIELSSGLAKWLESPANDYDCLSVTIPLKPEAFDVAISLDSASEHLLRNSLPGGHQLTNRP